MVVDYLGTPFHKLRSVHSLEELHYLDMAGILAILHGGPYADHRSGCECIDVCFPRIFAMIREARTESQRIAVAAAFGADVAITLTAGIDYSSYFRSEWHDDNMPDDETVGIILRSSFQFRNSRAFEAFHGYPTGGIVEELVKDRIVACDKDAIEWVACLDSTEHMEFDIELFRQCPDREKAIKMAEALMKHCCTIKQRVAEKRPEEVFLGNLRRVLSAE